MLPQVPLLLSGWVCADALGADKQIPRLDGRRRQLVCAFPGVVGEALQYGRFAGGVRDEKHLGS